MAEKRTGKGTRVKNLKEVKNLAGEIDNLIENFDLDSISDEMNQIVNLAADMGIELEQSVKYSQKEQDLAKDQAKAASLGIKYATSKNFLAKLYYGYQLDQMESQDAFVLGMKKAVGHQKNLAAEMKIAKEKLQGLKDAGSKLDGIFGDVGKTIHDAIKNPFVALITLMKKYSDMLMKVHENFGALGPESSELKETTMAIAEDAKALGFNIEQSMKPMLGLNKEFGIGVEKGQKLTDSVLTMQRALAMSEANAVTLMGTLTTIGGMSEEGALELAKQTEALARANDVAPGQVLDDMAENAEMIAKFSDGTADGLMRAAVQARKLGISLKEVDAIATGLLDFQASLNAELEASVMIGKRINLNRARELALAGDMENLQTEILAQIGTQSEFDAMNVLQKQKLASAIGISVDALGKMVSKEKEAVTLSGKLSEMRIENLVDENAITSLAELIFKLEQFGMQMAVDIGPSLLSMVEGFLGFVKAIDETIGVANLLIGILGILTIKMIAQTTIALVQMVAMFGVMIAKMGAQSPMGIGAIAGVILAGGIIASILAMIGTVGSMVFMADGGMVPATATGTPIIAGEGGEPEVVAPLSKLGTLVNVDNSELKGELAKARTETHQTNMLLSKLVQQNENYFGFGGTVAANTGRAITSGLEESKRFSG